VKKVLLVLLALAAVSSSTPSRASEHSATATATAAGGALELPTVLRSVSAHHPLLRAEQLGTRVARAKADAARGHWDPSLSIHANALRLGYYENQQLGATVKQSTPLWGARLEAGYRLGTGEYPAYKGELQTLSSGELRAGIEVPLWKDGPIDARRAAIRSSALRQDAQQCEQRATLIDLQRAAAEAYYRWVAAGHETRIQQALLDVAEERNEALMARAELGSVPPILVTDNERLVLDRRSKLVEAKRAFADAALQLSLFLRSEDLTTTTPAESALPERMPRSVPLLASEVGVDEAAALRQRPEIRTLRREREAAQVDLDLAENQVAPDLVARGYVSRDFGVGSETLAGTELLVGVRFEMPLLLTTARAKSSEARARVDQWRARERNLTDAIRATVARARVSVDAARRQAALAHEQVSAARQLARAERERFVNGASDLVVVNLREIAAADAERLEVRALEELQTAYARYLAALGTTR